MVNLVHTATHCAVTFVTAGIFTNTAQIPSWIEIQPDGKIDISPSHECATTIDPHVSIRDCTSRIHLNQLMLSQVTIRNKSGGTVRPHQRCVLTFHFEDYSESLLPAESLTLFKKLSALRWPEADVFEKPKILSVNYRFRELRRNICDLGFS
jgi:hypothetical protein